MIIIMKFGENNVLCLKYINIYEFLGVGGDVHIPPYIFSLLFKKTEKVQDYDLYLNQILHHFDKQKGGPRGTTPISLRSEYSSSNCFIAIHLTPGIFLI